MCKHLRCGWCFFIVVRTHFWKVFSPKVLLRLQTIKESKQEMSMEQLESLVEQQYQYVLDIDDIHLTWRKPIRFRYCSRKHVFFKTFLGNTLKKQHLFLIIVKTWLIFRCVNFFGCFFVDFMNEMLRKQPHFCFWVVLWCVLENWKKLIDCFFDDWKN